MDGSVYEQLQAAEDSLRDLQEKTGSSYSPVFSDPLVNKTADQAAQVRLMKEYGQRLYTANARLRQALDSLYEALQEDEGSEDEQYTLKARLKDAENGTYPEWEQMMNEITGDSEGGMVLRR